VAQQPSTNTNTSCVVRSALRVNQFVNEPRSAGQGDGAAAGDWLHGAHVEVSPGGPAVVTGSR
jgi:hypothetical protein